MSDNIKMVFLSGAGLNASLWDDVLPRLGRETLTIDYPNRGAGGKPNEGLSFDEYIQKILRQVGPLDGQKIILVAHSIGGVFINRLAAELGGRLLGVVAVGAVISGKGESFLSAFPWLQRTVTKIIINRFGTRPPDKEIRKGLCNDLPDEAAHKIVSGFTPESASVYTSVMKEPVPDCPSLYIILENDKSLPVSLQKKAAGKLSQNETKSIDSGHLPMLSQPGKLAEMISTFVRRMEK